MCIALTYPSMAKSERLQFWRGLKTRITHMHQWKSNKMADSVKVVGSKTPKTVLKYFPTLTSTYSAYLLTVS